MSYDLTIRSDENYTSATPKAAIGSFIARLSNVKPNGDNGFALDDRPVRWMEIDLEAVTEDGDITGQYGDVYDTINCVRLHIPYSFLGKTIERDYFPTAIAIAEHLGWTLYDDQTGKPVPRTAFISDAEKSRKPWWRFW